MATVELIPCDVRVVLRNVDWGTYLSLRDNDHNRNVRMTFDEWGSDDGQILRSFRKVIRQRMKSSGRD